MLALLTLTAVALPAAARAETVPEQDVSHINGQLVPVGEHNEYKYSFPKTNVSTNPLGWMYGLYGLSVSHAVHDHIAVRGDVNYFSEVDGDDTGIEVGLGLPIYFRRAYSGVFLEPGVIARRTDTGGLDEEQTVVGPQILAGWHWIWDSGLNISLAMGVGRDLSADTDEGESSVTANGYLRFGYAF